MTNDLLKLHASLGDAIKKWIEKAGATNEWTELNTYVGEHVADLMASSAFNVLLAQKDLSEYLRKNEISEP